MSIEENKALVRRYFDEENSKNVAALDEIIAADFVGYTSGREEVRSPEGLKQLWARLFAAFPDYRATIDDMVAEGDKVVLRSSVYGTHQGEFMGIPPTGREIQWPVTSIYRLSDGIVQELWIELDLMSLMQQLSMELKPKEGE